MAWLVLTIIFGIIGIAAACVAIASPAGRKTVPAAVAVGAGIGWFILTLAFSMATIGQRQVGLVQSFSGAISSNYKTTGVTMHAPWAHIQKENIGLQKEIFQFGADNTASSHDQQPITAAIAVNYRVEPADVIRLWKTVGPAWKATLLDGRIPQAFKETTATFTSPEITQKRDQLRIKTLQRLRRELSPYGIRVVDVFISNIGYSKEYLAAIEAKQKQVVAAQQAQAKVAQATAEADQRIEQARGQAQAIDLEGKALRSNPEVLKLRAIEKLAPNAQVIYCNSGDCPNIIGSLGGGK